MNVYESLLKGLQEAVEYEKGNIALKTNTYSVADNDIKPMRQKLEMIVEVDLADILCVDSTNTYGKCRPTKVLVRCKDCISWDEEYSSGRKSLGNYRCICHEWSNEEDGHYRYTAEDDFCSYAERREE